MDICSVKQNALIAYHSSSCFCYFPIEIDGKSSDYNMHDLILLLWSVARTEVHTLHCW